MDDDFNTAGAIGVLFEMASAINRYLDSTRLESQANEKQRLLVQSAGGLCVTLGRLLGLFIERPAQVGVASDDQTASILDLLVQVRTMARQAKQFEISDYIRDQLADLKIVLEDRPDGTQWRRES
jgi:cysteinyl-tRNA synthetase